MKNKIRKMAKIMVKRNLNKKVRKETEVKENVTKDRTKWKSEHMRRKTERVRKKNQRTMAETRQK